MAWTREETKELTLLYKNGTRGRAAAEKLGKSVDGTQNKARRLGLTKQTQASPAAKASDAQLRKQLDAARQAKAEIAEQLHRLIQAHDIPITEYFRTSAKFGYVTDTQFGSLYDRHDLVEKAYRIMHREGIRTVYHSGDLLDGCGIYRGHIFELDVHGADAQVKHVIDKYPFYRGMKTHFIQGNHDNVFWRHGGIRVGLQIASRNSMGEKLSGPRDDMVYCGSDDAALGIKVSGTPLKLMLLHPDGGTAYAISYKAQKHVESFSGGRKPHLLFLGHFHKTDFLPMHRNVLTFQGGCLQTQTPFMRRKGTPAHMGFWMIEVRATKQGIARCKGEWTPFFEL